MEPSFFLDLATAYAGPILSFFFGVFIADRIGLHGHLDRGHVYLMSIPVGLITTGVLLSSAGVLVEGVVQYGHTDSVGQYMTFCGTIMFYGTTVPELFVAFRARLTRQEQTKSEQG